VLTRLATGRTHPRAQSRTRHRSRQRGDGRGDRTGRTAAILRVSPPELGASPGRDCPSAPPTRPLTWPPGVR